MLVDKLQLVEGSTIESAPFDIGAEFPLSPTDKKRFEKTGANAGNYVFSTTLNGWLLISNVEFNSYDIGLTIFDRPKSLDIVCRHLAARTFSIRENFEGSAAVAAIPATGVTVFNIRLNGEHDADIGTLTFAAGATTGVFQGNASGEMILSAGVILEIVAPELRDATLANVAITIAGQLFV